MSSTTAARKPPLNTNLNRRSTQLGVNTNTRQTNRAASPSSGSGTPTSPLTRRATLSAGAPARSGTASPSPLSARSSARQRTDSVNEGEMETVAMMADLRSRLAKVESGAEAAAEEYRKQIKALQLRLDENSADYVKMEEGMHAKEETIETLEVQVKELTRAKRDKENIFEAERTAAQQEKEELLDREEELNAVIQRLKSTLAQRDRSPVRSGRNSADLESIDESMGMGFAPPTPGSLAASNGLLLQKDKLIEALRLELAEAQIKLAEADHLGGTKFHQLEQQLLETRMTNARLMEDNESFQLLLSSAAMNGDFPRGDFMTNAFSDPEPEPESNVVKKVQGSPRNSMSLGGLNLADELEGADQEENERIRKLEGEIKKLNDQNKALSVYIGNIIERILSHKNAETILDKTQPATPPAVEEKPLPQPPKEESGGFLARTKSLATRRNQPRPTEGLQRSQSSRYGHQRSQSEASGIFTGNNPRTSVFSGGDAYTSRRPRDSTASIDSGVSDINTIEMSSGSTSPPPSHRISVNMGPTAGNKLRPLRLVQENVGNGMMSPPLSGRRMDDDDPKPLNKNNKRTSWMGWFNRGKEDEHANNLADNVVFERRDVE